MSTTPRTDAVFSAMLHVLSLYDKKTCYWSDVANILYSGKVDLAKLETELAAATAEVKRWQKVSEEATAEREHNANVAGELRAAKAALREELIGLVDALPTGPKCDWFHHSKADRHSSICTFNPLVRYFQATQQARAALAKEDK